MRLSSLLGVSFVALVVPALGGCTARTPIPDADTVPSLTTTPVTIDSDGLGGVRLAMSVEDAAARGVVLRPRTIASSVTRSEYVAGPYSATLVGGTVTDVRVQLDLTQGVRVGATTLQANASIGELARALGDCSPVTQGSGGLLSYCRDRRLMLATVPACAEREPDGSCGRSTWQRTTVGIFLSATKFPESAPPSDIRSAPRLTQGVGIGPFALGMTREAAGRVAELSPHPSGQFADNVRVAGAYHLVFAGDVLDSVQYTVTDSSGLYLGDTWYRPEVTADDLRQALSSCGESVGGSGGSVVPCADRTRIKTGASCSSRERNGACLEWTYTRPSVSVQVHRQ